MLQSVHISRLYSKTLKNIFVIMNSSLTSRFVLLFKPEKISLSCPSEETTQYLKKNSVYLCAQVNFSCPLVLLPTELNPYLLCSETS